MASSSLTIWLIGILISGSVLIFVLAIFAAIASDIVQRKDRKKAIANTALAMNGSGYDSETQARMIVMASVSKSELSQKLFKLFENLSITSLVMIALAFVVFLLSAFF